MTHRLHVSKEEFIAAVEKATSVKELCQILDKTKPSVYTYASRYGVPLHKRWASYIRRQDGYYHYTSHKNHRMIMQEHLGRKLDRREAVHHIDGNKMNNSLSNLIVMDWSEHTLAHKSLEAIALELYQKGLVDFDGKVYSLKKVKGKK